MSFTYKPNKAGFHEAINGPEVRAALLAEGERAKEIAVAMSQDFRITGEYADSFEVTEIEVDFPQGSRPAVRLTNTSGHAAPVEYGYRGSASESGQSAHHVMKRTLDALGA